MKIRTKASFTPTRSFQIARAKRILMNLTLSSGRQLAENAGYCDSDSIALRPFDCTEIGHDPTPVDPFPLLLAPAIAQARGIEPELVAEAAAAPGGEVELAILMKTKPGWHGYWLNPGDAGLPMEVEWTMPPGFSVGPLRYPVPTRLTVAGIMNYVYEDDYAVLTRLKVPEGPAGRCRSRPKRAGSPVPTRSACPSRASFRFNCRSGASPRGMPGSTGGSARCRGRW